MENGLRNKHIFNKYSHIDTIDNIQLEEKRNTNMCYRIINRIFHQSLINLSIYLNSYSEDYIINKLYICSIDELQETDEEGNTPFMNFAKSSKIKIVKKMIELFNSSELKLSHKNYNGNTIFMQSLYSKNIEIINILVDNFTSQELGLTQKNNYGNNIFMECLYNSKKIKNIDILVDNFTACELGLTEINIKGLTPAMVLPYISIPKNDLILKIINKYSANDLNLSYKLKDFIKNETIERIHFNKTTKINKFFQKNTTAFMEFCKNKKFSNVILRMMKTFSADDLLISNIDKNNNTPFSLCCENQDKYVVLKMMENFSAKQLNLSVKNNFGNTSFMLCLRYQDEDVILKMMEIFSDKQLNISTWNNEAILSTLVNHKNKETCNKVFDRLTTKDLVYIQSLKV